MYRPRLHRSKYVKQRVGKAISLLVDYLPGEQLLIWYKSKKQMILDLCSTDVLCGPIPVMSFTLVPEMGLLQVGLVHYVRFAIWSSMERLNTLPACSEEKPGGSISTIRSFTNYLSGSYFCVKGKRGPRIEFKLGDSRETKLIAALQAEAMPDIGNQEAALLRKLNRRQRGV